MSRLRESFAPYWQSIQEALFPHLEQTLGPLTARQQQLVQTLEVVRIEQWIPPHFRAPGRPPSDRAALARAFVAKVGLRHADHADAGPLGRPMSGATKRICGEALRAELRDLPVPALLDSMLSDEALRSQWAQGSFLVPLPPRRRRRRPPSVKRGRFEEGRRTTSKRRTRLERQSTMTLPEMLDDLPTDCDVGTKKNSKGYRESWTGYKLHIDVADGQIPITCLLTSASVHDSQVAIPLATMSAERTTNFYDLMDAAYDAEAVREHSRSLGHVPLIDINPRVSTMAHGRGSLKAEARRLQCIGLQLPEQIRYMTNARRVSASIRLKDEFGGRHIRVRGASKVMCHCMFAVLALTADQLLRLVT